METLTAMQSSHKKKTLGNFFSLSLLQMGNYVLPMLTLPIISRIIGPDNYGVISYAFAYAGYFILLVNAGFDIYGSRLITANKNNPGALSDSFNSIISAKALLMLVATIIFFSSLHFIPQLKNEKMVSFFTFLVIIGWVVNPSWLYHGMQDSRKYALFSFISKLLFSVLVIIVVRQRDDYIYHPLITSLSHILISFISFYYAIKKYGLRLKKISFRKIKQTINENRKLSVIWWISNQAISTNIVLAGIFLTTAQVGYYSAALRIIIILLSIISMPLNTVLFPYIGEAFTAGHQQGMQRIHKTFPFLFLMALGLATITFVFAKPVILVFYGSEFGEAVILLKLLSCVLFFASLNSALGQQVLLNLKLDGTYMRYVLAGFSINIALLFLMIYFWGIKGAAVAWPISEIIIFLAYLYYLKVKKIHWLKAEYYTPAFLFKNLHEISQVRSLKKNK